jgi:hypothetical protein
MVKPRWQVFPNYAGAREVFDDEYLGDNEPPDNWEQRVRLAALLELVNAVANARIRRDGDFDRRARDGLAALASGDT